jgi:flagellar motility protein MotE (MotC chaperone)
MIRRIFMPFLLLMATTAFAADPPPQTPEVDKPDGTLKYSNVEERRLLVALQEERGNLDKERKELAERKKELKRLEDEVDKKLDELQQLRSQLQELLATKDEEELRRIKELSKMYEKMTADKAAAVLSTLDQDLAIGIIEHMKTKAAAKILSNMNREKAAGLTSAFSDLDLQ